METFKLRIEEVCTSRYVNYSQRCAAAGVYLLIGPIDKSSGILQAKLLNTAIIKMRLC